MVEHNPSYDDERELSKSLNNDKSAFRVSVSLQRYFKDVRARCYLMVPSKGQVHYLEHRIKTVFDLPGAFCLRANGQLLSSSEPLALLAPGDVVEVVPLEETQQRSPSAVQHRQEERLLSDKKCSPTVSNNRETVSQTRQRRT